MEELLLVQYVYLVSYRVMKSMKVTELPSLVYQLLVLSAKAKGHRTLVLEGIKILFNQLDQEVLGTDDEDSEDR